MYVIWSVNMVFVCIYERVCVCARSGTWRAQTEGQDSVSVVITVPSAEPNTVSCLWSVKCVVRPDVKLRFNVPLTHSVLR